VPSQGPRIRRYRLASVARRRGPRAPGSPDAVARAVGEHGHPGGTYD
jgi:hypothetical protein